MMNKAFEKILEKLKEQARPLGIGLCPDWKYIRDINAEKIVQEVAEEYNSMYVSKEQVEYMLDSIEMRGDETWMDYYHKALKGLCELTDEEYNDGWIPCSKQLPSQPNENPEFENKPLELYLVSIKGENYPFRAFWNGKNFTDGWTKLDVDAWQPLPEPYQPNGE